METHPVSPEPRWIVFFDGGCSLCDRSVRFLHARDRGCRLWFAPLQGTNAWRLSLPADLSADGTVLLVREENGEAVERWERGDALLKLAELLGGGWRIAARIGRLLPGRLRDALYRWVARNRYRWFGASDTCGIPSEGMRQRLLE